MTMLLRVLAIGFFFTIGVELALGLCMSFRVAARDVKREESKK